MNQFRKLKEYDNLGKNNITILNLMDMRCEFRYKNYQTNEWQSYIPSGTYRGEYDFLLEYYVVGIFPMYKIENNKIIPYMRITLRKEVEE